MRLFQRRFARHIVDARRQNLFEVVDGHGTGI
jgi:hypothetical protein